MKFNDFCPGCDELLARIPLVDLLGSYEARGDEIIEQRWHKRCYRAAIAATPSDDPDAGSWGEYQPIKEWWARGEDLS